MEKGKHERRKGQIFEKYSVLILIATLLMSIGYAEITGIDMQVATNVETTAQKGVFITDITRTEYSGADISTSKINSYLDTTMNSTVVLGSDPGSYITYNVSVYNKTEREQVFIGPFGMTGEGLYDNDLITYELGNLVSYETILEPGKNSYFTITFKYAGNDTSKNTLTSKINFRFMEVPELAITSEGEITGIYPGYTPQEYEFKVSNYNGDKINNVALSYGITAEIQKPFIAKIYDANGAEVTSSTAIDVAGKSTETGAVSKVDHTYKLKILWDNSNAENGVAYNSANYAGQTYTAKISLVATPKPNSEGINKYENYQLTQAKDITVKTAPIYLTAAPNNTTIEMTNNRAEINLAVSNNDGNEYNPYETKYTISQDNSKYTLYVDEVAYANNITGERTIGTGEKITLVEKIWLVPKDTSTLNKEETVNITINITSPYTQTKNIQIKITDTTGPSAPTITGGSESFTTSQTISVSEVATDVGTGVQNYEYLVNNTGEAIADASGNVGSTESETSKTFNTDYNGYYIWFRAVDKVGNKGEWSNSQQLNIETTAPTITLATNENTTWAKEGSVTVKLQDTTSGLATGASIKYGWSTSLDTEPDSYTVATLPTYTDGTTSEVTFTAEASGLTGQYYLWVVPTTLKDKAGNTQTGTVKSTGQFYFDNEAPSAGTLTMKIGNPNGRPYTNDSWTNANVFVLRVDGSDSSGSSTTSWTIDGTEQTGNNTTLNPGDGVAKTYTIVVTTVDVAGNTASNTYTIKIDKAGPSAPTISGGSTSWATSRTIKVDTASTDTGVGTIANYEYYLASDSTAPTASTTATASLGSGVTSKVFNDNNYNGYYVYFRAVDGVGNKGTWSSAQRLYIDTVSPTVTANNASITIDEGTSNTFESLFTVTWGGITTGTQTYTLNDASTSYTNTNELAAGTYTLKCTANKNNGTSAYASVTITVKAKVTLPEEETTLMSGSAVGSYSFTVPEGVNVVKLSGVASSDANRPQGVAIRNTDSEVVWGNLLGAGGSIYEYCIYVAVTPGKTYNLAAVGISNGAQMLGWASYGVTYSLAINSESPTVSDL